MILFRLRYGTREQNKQSQYISFHLPQRYNLPSNTPYIIYYLTDYTLLNITRDGIVKNRKQTTCVYQLYLRKLVIKA